MYLKMPFIINPATGQGMFVEMRQNYNNLPPEGAWLGANLYTVDDLDKFWFEQPHSAGVGGFMIQPCWVGMDVDDEGYLYFANNPIGFHVHSFNGLEDRRAQGAIMKYDPRTRQPVDAFSYSGEEKLEQPIAYLGKHHFDPFRSQDHKVESREFDRVIYDWFTGKNDNPPEDFPAALTNFIT
ncbi:MAG: hypothetical protein ACFB21_14285 [Opitutales bacterium]